MSRPSLAIAATFRDEHNALPGFLEMASRFADEIFLADCSMDMTPSTDGSLDIIRNWGLPHPPLWDLSAGFGSVRSQLLNSVRSEWCIIMDADERMHVAMPELRCEGTERFPEVVHPALVVTETAPCYNHLALLREKIAEAEASGLRAVRFQRRHWFDAAYARPCENWNIVKDYQLRCMKSNAGMGFTTEPRMHERAWDSTLNRDPEYIADDDIRGPFLEHLHCHFKPMEPEQRRADIAAYDALHKSDTHTPLPA